MSGVVGGSRYDTWKIYLAAAGREDGEEDGEEEWEEVEGGSNTHGHEEGRVRPKICSGVWRRLSIIYISLFGIFLDRKRMVVGGWSRVSKGFLDNEGVCL